MNTLNRSEIYFKNFNITDKFYQSISCSIPDIAKSAIHHSSLLANKHSMSENISVSWGNNRLLSTISVNTIHNFTYTLIGEGL